MNFRKSEMSAMEDDNQPLVDPFLIVNEELHDLICQHFTGKEAMELSTVSKQWNFNIGVSPAAMKKIMLVYDLRPWKSSSRDVTPILTSQRRYYNVKLKGLSIPRRTPSCSDQLQVVEKISGSVKDLEVVASTIGDIGLKFPKLQVLKFCYEMSWSSIRSILNGITASKLKVLEMGKIEDMQYFKDFLMKCNKMENFGLYDFERVHCFFKTEAATFPFKLKKFTMVSFNVFEWTPDMLTNFEKFLQTQSSSLQCLQFVRCNKNHLEASLKLLTSLKKLVICYPITTDFQLPVNSSVESLICCFNDDSLQSILTPLPNLKSLAVTQIVTINMVDTIASFAMNLRSVTYGYGFIKVEEYYEALKIQRPEVNQQIQWTSNANN